MTKLYPDNPHHDNYSEELGWEYLGTDDKYDYYVNHKWEYLSIVEGDEGHEYMSPMYDSFTSPEFLEFGYTKPAYLKLKQLLDNQKG